MASNSHVISDEGGSFEDWIELYNAGQEPVELQGYALSDDPGDLFKWILPSYLLQPGEKLLIWASGQDIKPEPHSWVNGIQRLYYPGIAGSSVDDLIHHPSFPNRPATRQISRNVFEAPTNFADHYGQHMYTWISPPQTGEYTFWIASDDNSRLYLSTDHSPENTQQIAYVPGWTEPRQWHKYLSQQSDPVYLEEGQLYYLSALMKEGWGGDNLAVRWQMPDGNIEEPLFSDHGYLPSARWHTNFRITQSGDELFLTNPQGTVVDHMPYVSIPTNFSYGRLPGKGTQWFYFEYSTPEKPNTAPGYPNIAAKPQVYPASGVYNQPVTVTLQTHQEDVQIFYTTDGSRPSPQNGHLYEAPFILENTTYLRAVAASEDKMPGQVAAATYTIAGQTTQDFSSNIPLMIIHQFDTMVSPQERTHVYISLFENTEGGRVKPTAPPVFSGRSKINIRGSSSQSLPKNNFGFHVLKEDNTNRKVSLLGMPDDHNWTLHGPYPDKTLMRNAVGYALGSDLGHYSPRTQFIELFMHHGNELLEMDHYHGVYVLTERIKIADGKLELQELEPHHDSWPEITGGYIFKKDRPNEGESGILTARGSRFVHVRPQEQVITLAQKDYLTSFLNEFEQTLFSEDFNDPELGYHTYIDPKSFIDMHLITELCKEIDGYRLSTFLHKDREGKLKSGPLWDFNRSLGNANYLDGWKPEGWYYEQISTNDYLFGWYNQLFNDDDFYEQYIRRYRSLRLTAFSQHHLVARILKNYNLLLEAQERNFERWDILGTYVIPNWFIGETYEDEVFWMIDWLKARLQWMDSQLGEPYTMMHYWNFNQSNFLQPTYSMADASMQIQTGSSSEVTTDHGQDFAALNARNCDAAGNHLRINDPVGTQIVFQTPSSGYKDLIFAYEARRSGSGANRHYISYSFNGNDFIALDTLIITENPKVHSIDLKNIVTTHDNPLLAIKILIDHHEDGSGGTQGNNRIDNVSLDGEALPETKRPPVQIKCFPQHLALIAQDDPHSLDLDKYFEDPDGDDLSFQITSQPDQSFSTHLSSQNLQIQPVQRGGATIALQVSDGHNPPLQKSFYQLVYPESTSIWENNYVFSHWSPDEPEGSFPAHMLFLQGNQDDPKPGAQVHFAYHIPFDDYDQQDMANIGFPYRNQHRTRINGLRDNGFSFINTGRDRDLGAAILAVNTLGMHKAYLGWQASTIRANSRMYHIRLQYRTDIHGKWQNWKDASGNMVEYERNDQLGHQQFFHNLAFPQEALNQPYVQIRWLYYYTGEQVDQDDGSRDMLAINQIIVSDMPTSELSPPEDNTSTKLKVFPNPVSNGYLFFSKRITADIYNMQGTRVAKVENDQQAWVGHLPDGLYLIVSNMGEAIRFVVANKP